MLKIEMLKVERDFYSICNVSKLIIEIGRMIFFSLEHGTLRMRNYVHIHNHRTYLLASIKFSVKYVLICWGVFSHG